MQAPAQRRRLGWLRPPKWPQWLSFAASWTALNVAVNCRYPARDDPRWMWFLPSAEVSALLVLLALGVRLGQRAVVAVVAILVAIRLFRFADGIASRFLFRPFHLLVDYPLVPELGRLLLTTVSALVLCIGAVAIAVGLVALIGGLDRSLRTIRSSLDDRRYRRAVLVVVGGFAVASMIVPSSHKLDKRIGAFGSSLTARLAHEIDVSGHRLGLGPDRLAELHSTTAALSRIDRPLAGLEGRNVLLFLVESYGATVLHDDEQRALIEPVWARFEGRVRAAGYAVRSNLLISPTYGGGSWFAHATLAYGARIADPYTHRLLRETDARSLVDVFGDAGYRTVLASPGTTREDPGSRPVYDRNYPQWEFGYAGPKFGWAPMPDQFVIDFIHRNEVGRANRPLFVQYALVSSHAPFDAQPPFIADWTRLENGSIYRSVPAVRFETSWADLGRASEAYVRALGYDFDVLADYLTNYVEDDSLVIILGDHQPTPAVTGEDPSWAVPIHVLSRDPAPLRAFERRGYTSGMRPPEGEPPGMEPRGMETFLLDFVTDFSP